MRIFIFQLRGAQILDVVRLHKNGFPESALFGEFWRQYKVLSDTQESTEPNQQQMSPEQLRSAIEDLLEELDLDRTAVRLGNTQVNGRISLVFLHLN